MIVPRSSHPRPRMKTSARPNPVWRTAAFRKPRLLIVGCGDIGQRVLKRLAGRWRVYALTSTPENATALRALGSTPLSGNLDLRHTLTRCSTLAGHVLHLAPPPGHGNTDPRTRHLVQALRRQAAAHTLVYVSTTGIYGPGGEHPFDESRPAHPATARAQRRVDAENQLRRTPVHGAPFSLHTAVLRAPGIYGLDRPGGSPLDRLRRGTPVLQQADDVHTNHIHAEDLARACIKSLWHATNRRTYNVCDDSDMRMGDYFDLAADLAGWPRPARITREEAEKTLSPVQMSFLSESRRLLNTRLKNELGLTLLHPTVRDGLSELRALNDDGAEETAAAHARSGS